MAVMTHAPNLPAAADYTGLTDTQRHQFTDWLDAADNAGIGDAYQDAMAKAARAAGIAVPDSYDIALCDCLNDGCGCGAIFDSTLPGVHVVAGSDPGYNLSRLQCPDCAHDHPRTTT